MIEKSKDRKAEYNKHFPTIVWDNNSIFIKNHFDTLIASSKKTIDSILSLQEEVKNYDTVVEKLAYMESELACGKNILSLLISSSTDEELTESYVALTEFIADLDYRADLYEILKNISFNENSLSSECDLYLNKSLQRKKRNGLHLSEDQQVLIRHIDIDIMKQCNDYKLKITEAEQATIKFDVNQLEGLSKEFIDSLDTSGEKFIVVLESSHVVPIMEYCSVISTRKIVEKIYNSRCIESNVEILEKILKLRHQRAQMLGYQTYADFATENLISNNADNVFDFLISLSSIILESSKKERERLLFFKHKECNKMGIKFERLIYPYELEYYKRIVKENDYSIDQDLIKEYFPLKHVTKKMLLIYESFFQVRFYQIKGTPTWHPKVKLYSVFDQYSEKLLGYFYLDLFMRPGKCNCIACFPIQCALTGGEVSSVSRAALLANFRKHEFKKPSLLTHEEVVAYFHEFGHLMHQITCVVRYTIFDGLSTEKDFVEAPSQMLENLVWDHEIIKRLSCHYKTKEKMSDDLINNICRFRKANSSLYITSQIMLSMFDFKIHTSSKINLLDVYKQCSEIFMLITPTPGTNFAASFRHACSGYEAQYYGYLWSEIIACDIYLSHFKCEGIFGPETGSKYRKYIVEPGSTKNGRELFADLMDRGPIIEPFLKTYGILS